MEATSARFAARDRFGPFGEAAQSPLQRFIQNAVDPQNYEPNLALNLEVADVINAKKGNAPREAAVTIVNYVNHRNANIALLALNLLDICVKNCGYPFHLQISTKEFLNELVRKFPERPPIRASRVQTKILALIEEWRQTICQTSKYKEDLGFVRDMHRLLAYKGYFFPEVKREDAAVLNRSDNLQSADEMEEEEKAAQSAKLQELIRRGGPTDLQEANRLMKIMAGYDMKHKTDYRAKAAEEVGKVQQKARLLEERLETMSKGDELLEDDVFDELASALQSAHPKIQKMCEEESDDAEAVAKLLEINDSIHRTIERYRLIKKGDVEGAARIPRGTLGTSTGVTKTADNELSLIDLNGDSTSHDTSTNGLDKTSSLANDLLGLGIGDDTTYGQTGGIALSGNLLSDQPKTLQSQNGAASQTGLLDHRSGPSSSSLPAQSDPFRPEPSLPSPSATLSIPAPNNAALPQQAQAPLNIVPHSTLSTKVSEPPQPEKSNPLIDGSIPSLSQNHTKPSNPTAKNAIDEDEWEFTSALPEEQLPSANTILVHESNIKMVFKVSRSPSPNTVRIMASVTNKSSQQVSDFTFQIAVTKQFSLTLKPQSGRVLAAHEANSITQPLEIHGVMPGQANSVRIRWKASYSLAGTSTEIQGQVPALGIH